MRYNSRDLDRMAKQITSLIDNEISKSGIFYRIFNRCKEAKSLSNKLSLLSEKGELKYDGRTKFLRDVIGIRINLYFVEDLEILTHYLKYRFKSDYLEETIDPYSTTEFKPTRINLIFNIPEEFKKEFNDIIQNNRVDSTFELQLRTVFSEGWHEVEHDFRYKCPKDWDSYIEFSRMFNGIFAALVTHEWSMLQIFERISYEHYKKKDYSAMIRTKFRIRIEDLEMGPELDLIMKEDEGLSREFFKLERIQLLVLLLVNKIFVPLTIDHIVYILNYFFIKNQKINNLIPSLIVEDFKKMKVSY